MIATVLSLLGGGLGGLLRILPEVFKLFTLKKDQDHEYRMTELQLKIDQARSNQDIDKVHANQSLEAVRGEMGAYIEALKGQGQMTGMKWIDGLNQSVRPVVTYWFMVIYSIGKMVFITIATIELWMGLQTAALLMDKLNVLKEFPAKIWTPEDAGILSMILGFWFVDRALKYISK